MLTANCNIQILNCCYHVPPLVILTANGNIQILNCCYHEPPLVGILTANCNIQILNCCYHAPPLVWMLTANCNIQILNCCYHVPPLVWMLTVNCNIQILNCCYHASEYSAGCVVSQCKLVAFWAEIFKPYWPLARDNDFWQRPSEMIASLGVMVPKLTPPPQPQIKNRYYIYIYFWDIQTVSFSFLGPLGHSWCREAPAPHEAEHLIYCFIIDRFELSNHYIRWKRFWQISYRKETLLKRYQTAGNSRARTDTTESGANLNLDAIN